MTNTQNQQLKGREGSFVSWLSKSLCLVSCYQWFESGESELETEKAQVGVGHPFGFAHFGTTVCATLNTLSYQSQDCKYLFICKFCDDQEAKTERGTRIVDPLSKENVPHDLTFLLEASIFF